MRTTFKRPKDTRYVDMAIWVDDNAYSEKCDDNMLFEYIYHLVYMLAKKKGYFNNDTYYDEFALYGATRVFMRLKNPKQFDDRIKEEDRLTKITSVLNYIKNILYPMKVTYEQENYAQNSSKESEEFDDCRISDLITCTSNIVPNSDSFLESEFTYYLEDILRTIYDFLRKIPYFSDKKTWINICLSCILTFIDNITIDNELMLRVKSSDHKMYMTDHYIDKMYREQSMNPPILYHLDPSMANYIVVLTNRLKKLIANDLNDIIKSHELSEDVIKSLLLSQLSDMTTYGEDE